MEPAQGGPRGLPGGSWPERWIGEGQGNRVEERVSGREHSMSKDLQLRSNGKDGAGV